MQSENAAYCSDLVKAQDEDRWLAAQYANDGMSRGLLALWALYCEIRRIPGLVSEPALGEIRLRWWRDALDEILTGKSVRAHPVVEEIAHCEIVNAKTHRVLDAAIEAYARSFYHEPFQSVDELANWLGDTDGAIDAAAMSFAGGGDRDFQIAKDAGIAFALAREGRILAPMFAEESNSRSELLFRVASRELKHLKPELVPAVLHAGLTPLYLARAHQAFPIRKRLRLFQTVLLGF